MNNKNKEVAPAQAALAKKAAITGNKNGKKDEDKAKFHYNEAKSAGNTNEIPVDVTSKAPDLRSQNLSHGPSVISSTSADVNYKREESSQVAFVTDRNLFPLDRDTKRKHVPLINECKRVYPCGTDGSILNRIFETKMEYLVTSPKWYGGNISSDLMIDTKLMQHYFTLVSDYLSVYYISLNITQLYSDYAVNSKFEYDKVMQSLLNDYFGDFCPTRKAFTEEIRFLAVALSRFSLPKYFVDTVESCFKFTSLPYQGFEILSAKSIVLSVPKTLFDRNYDKELSKRCDNNMLISYPFDPVFTSNPNDTYKHTLRLLSFAVDKLESLSKYDGEFGLLNSTLKSLCPEWKLVPNTPDNYCYIKAMSECERIHLLNTPHLPPCKMVIKNFSYVHYVEDAPIGKDGSMESVSGINIIKFPGDWNNNYGISPNSVEVDDTKSPSSTRWTMKRTYDPFIIFHDTVGGFKLTPEDMAHFSFPFHVSNDGGIVPKSTPEVIVEPGLVMSHPDINGVCTLYAYANHICSDEENVINVSPYVNKSDIHDYFSSISRKTGVCYEVDLLGDSYTYNDYKNLTNKYDVRSFMSYSSHPTLRKASLDFNVLRVNIEGIFESAWSSPTLVEQFDSKLSTSTRSEFRVYKVNVVSEFSPSK